MEEEYRHLNIKKVIIAIAILVLAFSIIVGSAIISIKARTKSNNSKSVATTEKPSLIEAVNQAEQERPKAIQNQVIAKNNNDKVQNEEKINKIQEETKLENTTEQSTQAQTQTASNGNSVKLTRIPVSSPNAIELCKQAQTSHEKNIYLTFDDGPSPNVTPQILAILKQYNVPATFFVLGSRAELYPELIRQEYNEGHYIANHGYSHQYSSIYSSVQSVIDEYNATDKAIQDALGTTEYHTLLFRFPGGSSGGPYNDLKCQAKAQLEQMGIASTNWNCLTGDAEGGKKTKEQLLKRLYQTADGWTSLVILMHDADDKQTTADALPSIIEHYKSEGYTFKNYYEIFK